jgi:hypothetical protein
LCAGPHGVPHLRADRHPDGRAHGGAFSDSYGIRSTSQDLNRSLTQLTVAQYIKPIKPHVCSPSCVSLPQPSPLVACGRPQPRHRPTSPPPRPLLCPPRCVDLLKHVPLAVPHAPPSTCLCMSQTSEYCSTCGCIRQYPTATPTEEPTGTPTAEPTSVSPPWQPSALPLAELSG